MFFTKEKKKPLNSLLLSQTLKKLYHKRNLENEYPTIRIAFYRAHDESGCHIYEVPLPSISHFAALVLQTSLSYRSVKQAYT